jgi:5'(3')-deoxyribonucleotidase
MVVMKLNKKKPLLIDLDCIVVDMLPRWLEQYNQKAGENIQMEDITEYEVRKFLKKPKVFTDILYQRGFFLYMPPMPGAIKYLKKLIGEGYDIVILTQAPSDSDYGEKEKKAWIRHHIPEYDISDLIFAHRKEVVMGSILFDDKPSHLSNWKKKNPRGITATIDYPYNQGENCDIRFMDRKTAWQEFYEFIKKIST